MKKAEIGSIATGAFADGDENGDQFVGFIQQGLQPGCGKKVFIPQQLNPAGGFGGFLQTIVDLGDEFRLRSSSVGFTIIRAHRSAGAQRLTRWYCLNWECAGTTALSDEATCRLVPKR